MSAARPSLVNDDFIRTWTISSVAMGNLDTNSFALTMREKPGGVVTGALFSILSRVRWREGERQGGCRRWDGERVCGSGPTTILIT